jgi:general stress protein YciG
VKKPLTISEFQRMGGNMRAAKLTAERRKQIASAAGKARAAKLSPERRKQIASAAGKKGGRSRARKA